MRQEADWPERPECAARPVVGQQAEDDEEEESEEAEEAEHTVRVQSHQQAAAVAAPHIVVVTLVGKSVVIFSAVSRCVFGW